MAGFAHPSLTNSQLSLRPAKRLEGLLAGFGNTLRVWRRRIHEREALARLTDRELADFGASRGDVYRVLVAPFWRAPPPC
jgi:uncharacterized protein YjiS (DUF1127 family)